jgi:hypothetical protein
MLTICLSLALSSLLQTPQAPPQTPTVPPPAPKPAVLEIRVTDRTGLLLEGARVTADGPAGREGKTDASGTLTFKTTAAGSYRFRIEREGYFGLEKEVTVAAGKTMAVEAALSPAPPPPPPAPSAPVVTAPPPLVAGDPRTVSIPDLAQAQELGKLAMRESPIGCSGATTSRLIQTRDPIAPHTHADADETLYVVAGEATLKMNGKEQPLEPGWFVIVPRGTEHSLGRKGKGPVAIVSTLSGLPCPDRAK